MATRRRRGRRSPHLGEAVIPSPYRAPPLKPPGTERIYLAADARIMSSTNAPTVAARNTSGITKTDTGPLARGAAARPLYTCISSQMQTSRTCPEIGPSGPGPRGRPTRPSRSRVPHLVRTHRIKETAIATPATTWLPASTTVGTAASRRAFQPTSMTAERTGTPVMIRTPAQPRNPTTGVPVGSGPRLRTQTTTFAAMKDAGRAVELAVPVTLKVCRAARQL